MLMYASFQFFRISILRYNCPRLRRMPKRRRQGLLMKSDSCLLPKNNGNSPDTNANSYPVKNNNGDKHSKMPLRFDNCFHSFRKDCKGARLLLGRLHVHQRCADVRLHVSNRWLRAIVVQPLA